METMTASEARAKAQQFDATLRATHPGFGGCVYLRHDDSTTLFYRGAFIRELEDGWFSVHTEHHGFHVYHKDEVGYISLQEAPHDWWKSHPSP